MHAPHRARLAPIVPLRPTFFTSMGLAVAILAAMPAATAEASIIAADDFSYADGPLNDQDGGTGAWAFRWIGFGFNVAAGEVDGTVTIPANLNEVRRGYTNPQATSQLFVSLDLRTPSVFTVDDFAGVRLTFGVNGNILTFGKIGGSNEFQVGASGFNPSGITIQPDTTYHLIGAYDVGPNLLTLWVNPDAADFYNPVTSVNSADASFTNPGIGHPNTLYLDTSRPGFTIDNLVLSDTAEGVGLASVPEPGGFLIWSIATVALSGLSVTRRREHLTSNGPSPVRLFF